MCQLKAPSQFHQCSQTFLFEENWHASSDLAVTNEKIINLNDLLCMDKICHVSFLINASIKIPGSSFLIRAPWNEYVRNFSALNKNLKTVDVALNDWKAPLFLDFILFEFFKKSEIPRKPVFNSHLLMLEGLGEIVLVRKVEAVPENFVKLSYFFKNLFSFWFNWQIPVTEVAEEVKRADFIDHDMVDVGADFGLITKNDKTVALDNNDSQEDAKNSFGHFCDIERLAYFLSGYWWKCTIYYVSLLITRKSVEVLLCPM